MIGSFERNTCGFFVYKASSGYRFFRAQGMIELATMPRDFNIWRSQLGIWCLAKWGTA